MKKRIVIYVGPEAIDFDGTFTEALQAVAKVFELGLYPPAPGISVVIDQYDEEPEVGDFVKYTVETSSRVRAGTVLRIGNGTVSIRNEHDKRGPADLLPVELLQSWGDA